MPSNQSTLDFQFLCRNVEIYGPATPLPTLVSPELRTGCLRPSATLAAILLPRYQPGAKTDLAPLTPGLSAHALIQTLVNARNLDGMGLGEAARLARHLPARSLVHGGVERLDPLPLDSLLTGP